MRYRLTVVPTDGDTTERKRDFEYYDDAVKTGNLISELRPDWYIWISEVNDYGLDQ